jgi:hypothetical protein
MPAKVQRITAGRSSYASADERGRQLVPKSLDISMGISQLGIYRIVSLGSNVGTLQQTMAAMTDAEALRSDLIGWVHSRVVGDRRV